MDIGRFFAINEIKMIVAEMLTTFDMKNVEGCEERYPNIPHASFVSSTWLIL